MLAAFDTTATTLTSICFQLALNPDIQEKLYESIAAKMEDYVIRFKNPEKYKLLTKLSSFVKRMKFPMKWSKTFPIWKWLFKKYCAFIHPLSGNKKFAAVLIRQFWFQLSLF
jgi:cytochrome P450